MKSVKIAELKDQLSTHLRAVEAGAVVEVTDRGRPIARIIPTPGVSGPRLIEPTRPFAAVRDRKRPRAGWSVDSTSLLLEERRDRRP